MDEVEHEDAVGKYLNEGDVRQSLNNQFACSRHALTSRDALGKGA